MIWRLLALVILMWTCPALAAAGDLDGRLCHAVTGTGTSAPDGRDFACAGVPERYQAARLWLRADAPAADAAFANGATLLVHQSRFDRLEVEFRYRDGHVERQGVAAGEYGERWRVGGQIAFQAPVRESPVTSILLALDRLESYPHFRVRLLPSGEAEAETSLAAALVGAAIALLALSTLYNGLLALASRRTFIGWHAAWVGTVFVWGLLWSQLALLVFPGLAGSLASKLCTLLATLAISFATFCAATVPEAGRLPRWARWPAIGCGLVFGLVGAFAAFPPSGLLPLLGSVLGILLLVDLATVALLLGWSWRRGDTGARDFILSWAVPMAVLASTEVVDYGPSLLGGGSQLAVLLASAFQTVWLSVAETLRLARLRVERDAAYAARWEMQRLAESDPLTALLNRRGFVDRAQKALRADGGGFALLLIDVDHFKSVNDRFGHDVGDAVLRCIARCIEDKAAGNGFAGRIGGEEFAIGVSGPGRNAIKVAASVREAIESLPLAHLFGEARGITASIGVSRGPAGAEFEILYREADRALYAAKDAGRNQVALFDGSAAAPRSPAPPGVEARAASR
ncbi:sensor domain-containing diguanylate cyclase [Sphingosinicella terrae]|uniref:sensor domain-containing diguanylate cyclase n=1 Tax=Sphingosinicella terrae TaxID=2172047 RepID=UPI000E0CF3A3|nr:diguanylate cyclase [Sphingosinicella terrae]